MFQDVLILSQFVRTDGCMLPRRITGLCKAQQKRIGTMVTMAQKAGEIDGGSFFRYNVVFEVYGGGEKRIGRPK